MRVFCDIAFNSWSELFTGLYALNFFRPTQLNYFRFGFARVSFMPQNSNTDEFEFTTISISTNFLSPSLARKYSFLQSIRYLKEKYQGLKNLRRIRIDAGVAFSQFKGLANQ